MSNQIKVNSEDFELVDQIDNITIADSFVLKNKVGRGHGEARLYLGSQKTIGNFLGFFEDYVPRAFFLKKDLIDYLNDAKFEYEEQEQGYQETISGDWQKYYEEVSALEDKAYFSIQPALGLQDKLRYYIRSDGEVWELFRKIMLPVISYITILKIRSSENNTFFLFRPILNYSYNKNYHPTIIKQEEKKIEESPGLSSKKKMQLVQARTGQGEYRRKLLEEKAECIISKVNDERLLIASHIKPWSKSNDIEKLDYNNGLPLTPTFDRMFDQGFISFDDDGTIIISPYISPLNIRKLSLIPGKRYDIPNIDKRMKYLSYHRSNIFKS